MDLRIGTSGWHYKHWLGRYYPDDLRPAEMLDWYLRDFDTVELNNTFYQLPKETSFDSWREATPANFLFAVKGSRFITHMIKLKEPARGLGNFPRARSSGSSRRGGTSTSSGSKSSCASCRAATATRSRCATNRG